MAKARAEGMPTVQPTERAALLIGFAGEKYAGAGAEYQGHCWQSDGVHGEVEQQLWQAAAAVDGRQSPGRVAKFSRASRTDRGTHAIGNVVCLTTNRLPPSDAHGHGWVARVNERLPADIRVLGRWPVETDFHAKNTVEKRRYEFLVPLHTLVADDPDSADPVLRNPF